MSSKIVLFVILLQNLWAAPQWTLTKKMEAKGQIQINVLTWKKGKRTQIYRPEKMPYGMTRQKLISIDGKSLWLTSWPNNGQSLVYRIFDPEIKNTPLCEIISYSDKTELRLKDKNLELLVVEDMPELGQKNMSPKKTWAHCRKL